jgi:hypothetical protein
MNIRKFIFAHGSTTALHFRPGVQYTKPRADLKRFFRPNFAWGVGQPQSHPLSLFKNILEAKLPRPAVHKNFCTYQKAGNDLSRPIFRRVIIRIPKMRYEPGFI